MALRGYRIGTRHKVIMGKLRLAKKRDKKASGEIKDDPRKIREVAEWNRIRQVLYHEAGHQAWGYPLYALHRAGKISDSQRDAGDAYYRAIQDYAATQNIDLEAAKPEAQEFLLLRIERAKKRYDELKLELGLGRKVVDGVIFDHEYPAGERQLKLLRACLERLNIYFSAKNKS